ncbi:MAG: hypothetical protein ACJAWO_002605 [Halieaceae bacterium]|jgi:uncharacterized protein (DUF302 family)
MAKTIKMNFEEAVLATTASLKEQGSGIITEIDMRATLKKKLDKDIPSYVILGACNPTYAYESIMNEPQVGVMLPCNVIVRQLANNEVEVAAVDPIASMIAIKNDKLHAFAHQVKSLLEKAVINL